MSKNFLFVIVLMLALVFTLASCNDTATPSGTPSDTPSDTPSGTPSHTHSYSEWTIVKGATCTSEGIQERICTCGEKETKTFTQDNNHAQLLSKIDNANFELSYSELYSIYREAVNHKAEYNCELDLTNIIENMLYGEWKDANDNYITYTYIYEDYNNTTGNTWYGTNLPPSKISGNTYYYYTEVKDDKLVIGYEDKLTEEKTDNFVITFDKNKISVENKINSTTYELSMSQGHDKVQKGNAKLAYIYIAKKIFSFKYPGSVMVTSCYVDYEEKVVYATIQATNGFGGTNNTDYKLYEVNGSYYITEYSHNYSTNIDLSELNQKLQAYVSTGG